MTHEEYLQAMIDRTETVEQEIIERFGGKRFPKGFHLQFANDKFLLAWDVYKDTLTRDGDTWTIKHKSTTIGGSDYTLSTVVNVIIDLCFPKDK